MLTIKCPQCQTGMKLQQAPAGGKVKCPKCSNIVSVGRSATPVPTAGGGQMLDPDDEGFDFGQINFPSAGPIPSASHFPVSSNAQVYEGPIPGDPLGSEEGDEEAEGEQQESVAQASGGKPKKKKKKVSPALIAGGIAGVLAFIVVGLIVAVKVGGGGGSGEDVIAAAKKEAPSGYEAVGFAGCVVLMPKGSEGEQISNAIEYKAVQSDKTLTTFYFGAMDSGKRELEKDQMAKKAERFFGGRHFGSSAHGAQRVFWIQGYAGYECPFSPNAGRDIPG